MERIGTLRILVPFFSYLSYVAYKGKVCYNPHNFPTRIINGNKSYGDATRTKNEDKKTTKKDEIAMINYGLPITPSDMMEINQ